MQQETRIRNLFYALFGGTFFILLALIGGYFFIPNFYPKVRDEIQKTQTDLDTEKSKADELGKAQVALVKAQIDREAVDAQLGYFRNRYFALDLGPVDFKAASTSGNYDYLYPAFDKWLAMYRGGDRRLGVPVGYGDELQRELDSAVLTSGVAFARGGGGGNTGGGSSLNSGRDAGDTASGVTRPAITIPTDLAPKNPEDLLQQGFIPANGLLVPVARIENMSVRGDLGRILRFFQTITSSRSRILKTVSAVSLAGSSPNIVANFSLTPYLLVRGASAPITATGGAAAATGAATTGAATPGLAAS